ncbi:hypothetical protein [Allohahella sp. A8]|uniref:hypothetical protein n=1 Tax=Allohahella sp. A8 TaxID=3141461 RepID=UPI003A80EF59
MNIQADSSLKVSGFATVGFSYENEDELGLFRDNTQHKDPDRDFSLLTDSQLGLQASYRFNPKWHATTQLVVADKAEYDFDSATEWAFVGYSPVPDIDIRAGRIAVDMFQLSDVRRVDYTFLWVRPPTEMYGWIVPYSIDGIDVAKAFEIQQVYMRAKLQYGSTKPVIQVPDGSQEFETEFDDLAIASLTGEYRDWSARISYAHFRTAGMNDEFRALTDVFAGIGNMPGPVGAEASLFASGFEDSFSANVDYYQLGLNYDDGLRIFNIELAKLKSKASIMPTGNAGYVSLGHRFGSLTPFVVYSAFQPDRDLVNSSADWSMMPGGEGLRDIATSILNGAYLDQYTTSLGLRWDPALRTAVKVQYDRTSISARGYGLWAFEDGRQDADSTVDVLSLSVNVIF